MNLTTLMKIGDNLNESSSLAERAGVGLQVVLIGMGVVFAVLLLLIGILQVFKLFAVKKPEKSESPVSAATPTPVVASAPVAAASASEEEKIVAIATAAIAASRGESECAFNVISIKKIV